MIAFSRAMAWAIGVLSLIGVSFVSYVFWIARDPIHIVHAVAIRSPVRSGEPLTLEATVTRTRYCNSIVSRYVVNDKTGEVVWSGIFPGGATGIGYHRALVLRVDVPKLPSGRYIYRSLTANDCGLRYVLAFAPDAYFDVVP